MPHVRLLDRATLVLSGEPVREWLQSLVTGDVESIGEGEMRPSALLTPQGKILFDFLIGRTAEGLRVDAAATARGDLAKRLAMYRLRAPIVITPTDEPVFAVWDEPPFDAAFVDRRFPGEAVARAYEEPAGGVEAPADDFALLRLRAGIIEAERDFPAADVFPHDVLLDQNGGVSFRKGCFVGQEVVSRMQHRGTARRRLMLARAEGHLTPGAEVLADKRPVGTVLAAMGQDGVAMIRIDRFAAAIAADAVLEADGVPVDLSIPEWAGYAIPAPGAPVAEAD